MDYGLVLQIIFIIVGIMILLIEITLLAKRKLSESISITWGFVAIVIIVSGIVLRPTGWINYMSEAGLILLLIVGFCVLYGLFLASCHISEIIRKQTEMAMDISLLNQEVVELKRNCAEKEKELSLLLAEKAEKMDEK